MNLIIKHISLFVLASAFAGCVGSNFKDARTSEVKKLDLESAIDMLNGIYTINDSRNTPKGFNEVTLFSSNDGIVIVKVLSPNGDNYSILGSECNGFGDKVKQKASIFCSNSRTTWSNNAYTFENSSIFFRTINEPTTVKSGALIGGFKTMIINSGHHFQYTLDNSGRSYHYALEKKK